MKKIFSVIIVLLMLLAAGVAAAHADLKRASPAENAVLDQAPPRVTIEFTEPVEPRLSKIEVLLRTARRWTATIRRAIPITRRCCVCR